MAYTQFFCKTLYVTETIDIRKMKLIIAIFFTAILGACSSAHRVNGWYPVADIDIPENKIEGNVIVTAKDFDVVNLDTVSFSDMAIIEGKLKAGKVKKWADATENRIGKRMGFVFNDSLIMAPTINCRIESGSFTINSPDKVLMSKIYDTLK